MRTKSERSAGPNLGVMTLSPTARPSRGSVDSPRRQSRPDDKEARITATATAVFGSEGYSRARIDAICRSAGVSVGTFYSNFENKADLLLHVAELAHESFSPPRLASFRELEEDVGRIVASPSAGLMRAWLEAICIEPELRTAYVRMRATSVTRFSDSIRKARAARGTRTRLEDETAARAVMALLREASVATYEAERGRIHAAAHAIWYLVHG